MSVLVQKIDDHIEKAILLAGSMVIKNTDSEKRLNDYVALRYGGSSVGATESDWKYYKNLYGELHTTDTAFSIVAIEDQTLIPFNKASLSTKPVTRHEYRYGTELYYRLVRKYPNMELYIKGVLYPSDPSYAISAEDGTILQYDSSLVEDNEWFLITETQKWIYNWLSRWDNKGFGLTDDLYPAAKHAILSLYLPLRILAIRLKYSNPITSNSFYRDVYNTSHYDITEAYQEVPEIIVKWLHRNGRFLKENKGKQGVLEMLIDNVAKRSLIAFGGLDRFQSNDFSANLPDIFFTLRDGEQWNEYEVNRLYTETDILHKQRELTYYNDSYRDYYKIPDLKYTRHHEAPTGTMVSDVADLTDAIPHSYSSILLDTIGYIINSYYTGLIGYRNSDTGIEHTLSVKDAFFLYIWFLIKKQGGDPIGLPTWSYIHIPISTNAATIQSSGPADVKIYDTIQEYDNNHVLLEPINNVTSYRELINEVYSANLDFWLRVTETGSKSGHGILRNIWSKYYSYGSVIYSDYSNYSTMFNTLNIQMPATPSDKLIETSIDSLEKSLFGDIDSETVRKLQDFLKQTLGNKISYTSHVLFSLNDSKRLYGRLPLPRADVGTISEHYALHGVINEPPHEDIYATGDWFIVSFDQLTQAEQATLGDIWS